MSAFGVQDPISGNGAYTDTFNGSGMEAGSSGQVPTSGTSISASIGNNTNQIGVVQLSIAPFTAVVDEPQLASSAAPTNQFYNKYAAFIGFAAAAITGGVTGSFVTSGVATGFSGLTPGVQYYLSDTPGAIGTSPGTNTRKVGIAISTTTLLITNTW